MKKGFVAAVALVAVVAGTALIVQATDAFGFGKGMGSETPTVEQITEHMQEKGFTEEQIEEKLSNFEERKTQKLQVFATLMGIDVPTLEGELDNATMPELLDKYNITHVDLHDAMQTLQEDFPHHKQGYRGFGLGQ